MDRRTADRDSPILAYRAYTLGEDNKVQTAAVLEAHSDDEAVEVARKLVDRHPIELWDRGRFIARLDITPS